MLKTKKIYALAVIILICVGILFVSKNISHNNIPKLNITQTSSLNDSIDITLSIDNDIQTQVAVPVYKMKPIKLNEEAQKIKKAFGLSNIDFQSNKSYINIEDEMNIKGAVISLEENGYWSYTTDMAFYTGENLPTKDQALEIADKFIKENDIFPIEKLGNPTISELSTGDGISQPREVLAWNISYNPKIYGKDVCGIYRICVSVGSNGKIVGVDKLANDYELVDSVNLKDYKQINSDFESGNFALCGKTESDKIVLSNIQMKYYVQRDSEYIQPVYIISDKVNNAEIIIDAHDRAKI